MSPRQIKLTAFLFPLAFLLACFTARGNTITPATPGKIITIVMAAGLPIHMGRDTADLETIPALLAERLWKSFLGTGKMYDSVRVVFEGDVPPADRSALYAAIGKAQQLALKKLCLEQHKRLFEQLGATQQQRIRQKFKILFQQPPATDPIN